MQFIGTSLLTCDTLIKSKLPKSLNNLQKLTKKLPFHNLNQTIFEAFACLEGISTEILTNLQFASTNDQTTR